MTSVVLDTHVVQWWSAEPDRLSKRAAAAIAGADELAVASITWFELAWMARNERIIISIPLRSWLEGLSSQMRTMSTTAAVAATAVELPSSFPGDPADRLIYATAIEHGWSLITKDQRIRSYKHPRPVAVW
jgi:PIN domain nuclease of toxin-antitoxin system